MSKTIFLGGMKKVFLFLVFGFFCATPLLTFAQEAEQAAPAGDMPDWQMSQPADTGVNCFDYYKFQSVSVSVGPDQSTYQPGTAVRFSGTVVNDNEYPVVDGNLFVRIGKKNEKYIQEGQYIVDEFIAVKNIAVDAKNQKKVDFSWNVPIQQSSGDYVVNYFFSVGGKFNLGGLPFSNEVIAGLANFSVGSTVKDFVSFDKAATVFNGKAYQQIGSWPTVSAGTPVAIKNALINSFETEKTVNVTQELYRWDSLNIEDKLDTRTETMNLPAGATKDVTYNIPSASGAVYYLKTTATYDDGVKSIINVRFSTDAASARLNYPAINKFPLNKGDDLVLFSCFHNSTGSDTQGNVHIVLTDEKGDVVGEASYKGDIPSAMSAIKQDIKAKEDYGYLKIRADITNDKGVTVDHYETVYDCAQIGRCKVTESISNGPNGGKNGLKEYLFYAFSSLFCIVIIFALVNVLKKRRGSGMSIFLFGLILAGGLLGGRGALAVGDQSISSSSDYALYQVRDPVFGNVLISTGNVSLNHYMNVSTTNVLCGGSTTFFYGSNLFYNANGGSWDTPYGGTSIDFGNIANVGQLISGNGARGGYIHFTYNNPGNPILTSSNPAVMTCTGMTCSAVPGASGTARITAYLGGTTTRIWGLIAYYKPRCDEYRTPKLSCIGSILSHPRCSDSDSTYWVSPTEDNFSCGGGNIQSSAPNFTTLPLGGKSLSWDITVGSCAPINGECNPLSARNDYASTATGPSLAYCSAGTPSPATTISFPTDKYGVDSTVNWSCNGSNGGTNAACSAARIAPNNPPSKPILTGPSVGFVNTSYNFTVSGGTDLDGDNIQYQFDWNNDGAVDQSTAFVASSTAQTLPYQWTIAGSKNMKVKACDTFGDCSLWSDVSVIIISNCVEDLNPAWSDCTSNCGSNGTQTRTLRYADCHTSIENQGCNQVACPQWREVIP